MDPNKLHTALAETSEILSRAIIQCQLSPRAKDSEVLGLRRQLDDALASILLYKCLSNTLPLGPSTPFLRLLWRTPTKAGSFIALLDALRAAKATFGKICSTLTSTAS